MNTRMTESQFNEFVRNVRDEGWGNPAAGYLLAEARRARESEAALLEALRGCMALIESGVRDAGLQPHRVEAIPQYVAARAAIAKATGG